ncbi:uncharacterized protein LOC111626913 [Centruroides sculpturatus]|uniref:uncharacterized protein LOC111626912 n=1 Tax=Centruroides sculpturatus TaxID=218467 RepID=UPI000C6EABED|nr:uncharacterized protein LOC111626912 [Centruroides sculpturatus]XP_023226209.1 uncharacterized protein LOC111626913 [Centruroides sculpturatus]
MRFLILLSFLAAARAGDDSFSIGLGVLAPSYSQRVGPDGSVKVNFDQQKNGFSYSVTNGASPTSNVQQQTAVAKDGLGGHTITHQARAAHTDPFSGATALKHKEHSFHINPYLGRAAVHTNAAAGQLNPLLGQASFAQNTHNAQIAPGHSAVADTASRAAISPFGNSAAHSVRAAQAQALPGGVAFGTHAADNSHASLAGYGTFGHASVQNANGFQGPGYGAVSAVGHSAQGAYDAHGFGQTLQQGYRNDGGYNAHLGLAGSDQTLYSRQASHDPYGNYGAVTHSAHSAQAGHLGPSYASYYQAPAVHNSIHAGYGPAKAYY